MIAVAVHHPNLTTCNVDDLFSIGRPAGRPRGTRATGQLFHPTAFERRHVDVRDDSTRVEVDVAHGESDTFSIWRELRIGNATNFEQVFNCVGAVLRCREGASTN